MENKGKLLINQYNNADLLSLVERLERDYYDKVDSLSTSAQTQAIKLKELEVHQSTSQYVSLCIRLTDEIINYITGKRAHLVPYLQTLHDKKKSEHDCSTCTGAGCSVNHAMQLSELKESHIHLKDILNRLQMASLPLYSDTIYPDIYRILRNQMALLENSLTELFFVEETYLVPKVIEAQKSIHVHN